MFKNLLKSTFRAKPFLDVIIHQFLNQIFSHWTFNLWQLFLGKSFFNFFEILFRKIIIPERSRSHKKLINQNSETIVIKLVWITFSLIYFRRHRMSCTADCKRPLVSNMFSFTKINHRNFPFLVYHKIRSLNISVNIAFFVKGIHNQGNLRDNQSSELFIKRTSHLKQFM